jgi:galactokinase/mevalonate kinase-like predicted kinase
MDINNLYCISPKLNKFLTIVVDLLLFKGSLLCSILVVTGYVREELFGGERHQFFDFSGPHGSGLGASSILAGALLAALYKLRGHHLTEDQLIKQVLQIEQLHTSGGGWQDQLGGCIIGGAKIGWIQVEEKRNCCWRTIPFPKELIEQFSL